MTEPTHKQTSPALVFLKKNAVVVVLAGALVAGVGVYAVNAAQPDRTAVSTPVPSINSTASLAGGPMVAASATASPGVSSASGASGATGAPSGAADASGGSQAGAGVAGGSAAQPAGTTSASASPVRPQTTVTVGTAAQAPTIKDWRPVAEAFSKAFVNPSVGKEAWLAAIKPYCTPALFEQYKVVDITRIPQDSLKYVNELRHSERTYVFSPNLSSGKNIFTATADIQDSTGTWLVGHVGGPE